MSQGFRKNGTFEIKFNEERTQALATIYPPSPGGAAVTTSDILERLKTIGITYGVREQAILETIHRVQDHNAPVVGVVVAQGVLPQNGIDAKVRYHLPVEDLSQPVPKRADGSGLPNWFALSPSKMVQAGAELASILPPQLGTPGKTLTWPVQPVPATPGKPAALNAGANVRTSEDSLHLYAAQDGYACLHGETLLVHALRIVPENVGGGAHLFSAGAVYLRSVEHAQIKAYGFVAIQGTANGCRIRAHEDVFLQNAQDCEVIATGNVYLFGEMNNCHINTRKKLIGLGSSRIVGGEIFASEGVEAARLGSPDFAETQITVGVDRLSPMRNIEIGEELVSAEENIARISQALKPFASQAAFEAMTDDKRQLFSKLQAQKRSQEARINELHGERRSLSLAAKEKFDSVVTVSQQVHPGVWITIEKAATQIEAPLQGARFVLGTGGKYVEIALLPKAA